MTISLTDVANVKGSSPHVMWQADLDSSSTTPLEQLGAVREDFHPAYGPRKFVYVKFANAINQGLPARFVAPTTLTATAGTTTSFSVALASDGLYNGWNFRVLDDAGAAGAAPEGQSGRIKKSTTTTVYFEDNDALSVALAANDTVQVWSPWVVGTSANGDTAAQVAGFTLADQAAGDYGWVQYVGEHPYCVAVAAGTAIAADASVIIGAGPLVTTIGAGALSLAVGMAPAGIVTDTVLRRVAVKLCCGLAAPFGD